MTTRLRRNDIFTESLQLRAQSFFLAAGAEGRVLYQMAWTWRVPALDPQCTWPAAVQVTALIDLGCRDVAEGATRGC